MIIKRHRNVFHANHGTKKSITFHESHFVHTKLLLYRLQKLHGHEHKMGFEGCQVEAGDTGKTEFRAHLIFLLFF